MYLLDTNVCIKFLNKKSKKIEDKLFSLDPDQVALCSVVKAELLYGAYKSKNQEKTLRIQREFCEQFRSFSFNDKASEVYGRIRADLEKQGRIIGPNDLMIAAIAIANQLVLITNNMKEFSRVADVELIDWE